MPPLSKVHTFPNGETIELFYIKTLADELGRSPRLIRKWEIGNVIPDPCFRDKFGKRLYSKEQIDIMVKCAERAQIRQGKAIAGTSFSTWVHRELAVLKKKYAEKR